MEFPKVGNESQPIEFARGVHVRRVTKTGYGVTCPDCRRRLEAGTIGRLRYLYREHRHHAHQETGA